MRLRKKRSKGGVSAIPTESFADLAFLLIVFFLLTTTLHHREGFMTDIPAGEVGDPSEEDTMPTVTLHEDQILWDDNVVTVAELRQHLLDLRLRERSEEERIVILQAVGEVPYQPYFELMALIASSGGVVTIVREGD
jgi:biopolymer transport protein ExbD